MIRYIPTSGSAVAIALSDALWGLARPRDTRSAQDTQSMFGTITCTDGSIWLQVDTVFDIPVHPEVELDGIADILQPWIDEGALPQDTNTNLTMLIESLRGQRLTVWEAFPKFFKDQAKTREELLALGLLTNPIQV